MIWLTEIDLAKGITSDKALRDNVFDITKNPKYGYQRGLASMVYNIFDKKSAGTLANKSANNEIKQNRQLAEELRKPIIRKF